MIEFTLSELCKKANATLVGEDSTVLNVSTNSKNCADKNTLFIALIGEKFDAHNFVLDAINNGASFIAVSKKVDGLKEPYIICEDTQRLLGLCGALVVEKSKAKVVSITGSCGKTTVKEMTLSILSKMGKTIATQGNFNNDIGVPLTLLTIDKDTEYAVIEQGASHLNDLKRTCEFVQSEISLITNVGGAHIEGFGSYEGVYKGKSEILDCVLKAGGKSLIPYDSEWFPRWCKDYKEYIENKALQYYGTAKDCLFSITNLKESTESTDFTLVHKDFSVDIHLNLIGSHNAQNAAAAASLAYLAGATKDAIEKGLNDTVSIAGRFNVEKFDDFTLIDDAYNASYNAVIAAINTLNKYDGFKVMVFGDMGELGQESVALHQKVGKFCTDKVDKLLCIGPQSLNSVKAMGHHATHFADHKSILTYINTIIDNHKNCTIVVKGSHAMHMDIITNELRLRGKNK